MLDGRIMCLDMGEARIGVAVSDLLGFTAQGAGVISNTNFDKVIDEINKIISEKQVNLLLVGYPLNLDGSQGKKAESVREQYQTIKENIPCDAILWDERLSTKQAERALDEAGYNWEKKRKCIDEMAAQIILQSYLDTNINK